MGQHLDVETSRKDYSYFTVERYNTIIKYKTSYYTINLPIALGFLLTNNTDKKALSLIEDISIDIGNFFQVQVSRERLLELCLTTSKVQSRYRTLQLSN